MPDPIDRLLSRALIALLVVAAITLGLGLLLNAIDARRNRSEQAECRTRGGQVVLLARGAWRCVSATEGR